MTLAILRVMLLGVIRDRGALVLAFILPPAIFVIFAAIFAGASGAQLHLNVAIAGGSAGILESDTARRLIASIEVEKSLRLTRSDSESALREQVRRGDIDVGIVVRGDLVAPTPGGNPPIVLIADATRAMAIEIVRGQLERELFGLFGLMGQVAGSMPTLVVKEILAGSGRASGAVTYYAGAVAILFLLLTAMQGAASFIDERQSGIMDRLLLGPGSTAVVLNGKFLFLLLQGTVQAFIIFLVGWLGYGIDLPKHFGSWLVTTILAAAAAAGLGLALAALCTSRAQASALASFLVLIVSALGGSMVPRFLMPEWLQSVGWWTPNAWAIEAYYGDLWRGQSAMSLVPPWAVLAAIALGAYSLAHAAARGGGRV